MEESYRTLLVPGDPAAWRAPDFKWPKGAKFPVKKKHKKHGHWQNRVALAAEQAGWFPFPDAVWIAQFFFTHRPKGHSTRTYPDGPIWRPKTPDYGNFAKATEDGLKGLAYHDDKQIVAANCRDFYHAKAGKPMAVIFVGSCGDLRTEILHDPIPQDELFEEALALNLPPAVKSPKRLPSETALFQ